jgi:hypothetical protein
MKNKKIITKTKIAFSFWLLIWLLMSYIGINLYLGVISQKISGYPNYGQLEVYVILPNLFVVGNILLILYGRKVPIALRFILFFIQFLILPTFIFYGSGGV